MSNNDQNQPSVGVPSPRPAPTVAVKDKTQPANPQVKEPDAHDQGKVSYMAPAHASGDSQ